MIVQKLSGPKCVYCNCADSRVLGLVNGFSGPEERRECRACGRTFRTPAAVPVQTPAPAAPADPDAPVPFVSTKCPLCGAARTKIVKTYKPLRHHLCESCGHKFKSQEE